MLLSTVLVAVMHALIRETSRLGLHPFEIAFFRNVFGLLVAVPWLVRYGLEPLRTSRIGLHGVRAVLNTAAMLMFFTALSLAPLAQVTALGFAAPIFATVLTALVFREFVGIHRWIAILVGFVGTLIVLRPGFTEIGSGPIFALCATMCWSVVILIIRSLGRTESSITITTYMSLLMAPMALIPALFVWRWPSLTELALLAVIGVIGNLGQLALTQSIKIADTQVVMPFDFMKLVWVSIIAFVFFAELPDLFTYIGGGLVFACGAYIAYRERLRQIRERAT